MDYTAGENADAMVKRRNETVSCERRNSMTNSADASDFHEVDYPTGDGKPMAEGDVYRDLMCDVLQTLQEHFALDPMICVSGNLLMYYEQGNPRKVVAPDIFVVRGVEKRLRENYLIWSEGKGPDIVIEITSRYRKREDRREKLPLYRNVLKVPEYFYFDPEEDYLEPPLQGFRLVNGAHCRIEPVDGRLPSEVLGLHLERDGRELRFYDPVRHLRLLTLRERASAAEHRLQTAKQRAEALRRELEALRRHSDSGQ
jgi:Uma2 family endonuclease